ncbi:MAG: DUF624 domain-containing protein [Erysipelotrichaceae bacterium]|nr:DUF624 domain-containing protein [Erysipelotrichaceae bacterium]
MRYDSPFIKFLEAIANMLIGTFLWFLFSLPVITVFASGAALYHCTVKVIFGEKKGNGVFRDFFDSYRSNLVPGIKLSLIALIALLFVAEGLWTGYQIWRINIWGLLYLILGIVISSIVICTLIYIPPVLSRFEAPVLSIIRLAVWFAMKKPLRSIFYLLLLGALILGIQAFPLAIVIIPGVYADLIRTYLEKDLQKFIEENGLAQDGPEEDEETLPEEEADESSIDLDRRFAEKEGKRKK